MTQKGGGRAERCDLIIVGRSSEDNSNRYPWARRTGLSAPHKQRSFVPSVELGVILSPTIVTTRYPTSALRIQRRLSHPTVVRVSHHFIRRASQLPVMGRLLWVLLITQTAVVVLAGGNDLVIVTKEGAEATVHRHGATVISWKVDGQEQLFLSEASKLDGTSHIMGGVPIVFPKFADWGEKRPFHGFARVSRWNLIKVEGGRAEFELKDTEVTRSYWNHTFHLNYSVILEPKSLRSSLIVRNPSPSSGLAFEVLYHTFVRVPDVRNISISGLKDLKYRDKTRNFDQFVETRELVEIGNFTDSVYQDTPATHVITNVVGGKTMELTKKGLPDLVVWNPWSEVIKTFTDLRPNEWTDYICTEAGHVVSKIELPPGCDYEATQTLRIL